jgi:endonuclease/exonuclease/phosphatase family metal-dependent hydrolase
MKRALYISFFAFLFPAVTPSQDTVRLMTYNILNYPYVAATRADTLAIIIDDVLPDIMIINELQNNSGATTILNNAMNTNGRTYYSKAIFFNGPDSDNMCYYDNSKFGLSSQRQLSTSIRDISEYVLYWKGNLPSADTIFLNVYSVHLKAGNSTSDEAQRLTEAQVIKNRLDERSSAENVFVGGDFNIYSNIEASYTELTTGGIVDLYDPINSAGSWHANATYANIHTQATGSINGGSGGGLDDRFDFFFVNSDIVYGDKSVQYITNTYTAYGQDGNRYNSDLNVWPANTVVAPEIASALYNMSDHLPVIMDVVIDPTLGIDNSNGINWKFYYSQETGGLVLSCNEIEDDIEIEINDLTGKRIKQVTFGNSNYARLQLNNLRSGAYIATVSSKNIHHSIKFIVHQ